MARASAVCLDNQTGSQQLGAGETLWSKELLTYLLLVMQAFIVVFEGYCAFLDLFYVFAGAVDDIAGEDFLPEGKAAAGT